jgi:hypothetical protein
MIAVGPFVVSTGYLKQELQLFQSSPIGANSSKSLPSFDSVANQGELIVLTGSLLAPLGAGLMAYGLTAKKPEPAMKTGVAEPITP